MTKLTSFWQTAGNYVQYYNVCESATRCKLKVHVLSGTLVYSYMYIVCVEFRVGNGNLTEEKNMPKIWWEEGRQFYAKCCKSFDHSRGRAEANTHPPGGINDKSLTQKLS